MAANYALVWGGGPGSPWAKEQTAYLAKLEADVRVIDWEPLREGRVLGEWDMVWTGDDGRLEIEVLPDPKGRPDRSKFNPEMTVPDEQGHATANWRLPRRAYLILQPDLYVPAKVNRIRGTVFIARDHDQVRKFFAPWKSTRRMFGKLDRQGLEKRKEFLRSPTLE